jgi:hypothetical protein
MRCELTRWLTLVVQDEKRVPNQRLHQTGALRSRVALHLPVTYEAVETAQDSRGGVSMIRHFIEALSTLKPNWSWVT